MNSMLDQTQDDSRQSRERVLAALGHRAGAVPIDFGGTFVTGIHVSCIAPLRRHYGLDTGPVKVIDPGQMLGEIAEDLALAIGIGTAPVRGRMTRFGFPEDGWKPWRMYDGTEVLVPAGFNVTVNANGDTLMHPQGDTSAPASAVMPKDGYFFDGIERPAEFDEDNLDPRDNLEEYRPLSDKDLDYLEAAAGRARRTGRAVVASFGGTAFGDVVNIPGVSLRQPRGIRSIAEWYVSTASRREFVHKVFEGQCEIALANLERIAGRVGDLVDVVNICGTDFGTQKSTFCSTGTFRELWLPYYRLVNGWIHQNTTWKTFKHSCGAVAKFIPAFIESGFDILNPVQCSAAGMEAEELKSRHGDSIVFWGGGVDTQQTLPFGSPREVREQVLRRCEVFSRGGGFVFCSIHNIQARTPVENIVAMIEAVQEFNGVPARRA